MPDESTRAPEATESLPTFLSTFQLSAEETVFASASVIRDHEVRLRSQDGSERVARIGVSRIPVSTEKTLALLSVEPNGRPLSRGGS